MKFIKKNASKMMMLGSLAAILLSAIGFLGMDIWLASTQWLIVSTVLALFGLYLRLEK